MFKRKGKDGVVQVKELHNSAARWPSGCTIKTPSGIWFIKSNKRYRCFSDRTVSSWQFSVIEAGDKSVEKFAIAGVLGFRDGTLIKDISDGKIYLVSDSKVRHITDPDTYELLGGIKRSILVSHDEVKIHSEGEPIAKI